MRILGIDPGVATTGLGLVTVDERGELTHPDWLTIETPAGLPLAERLAEIEHDLSAFLKEKKPNLAVVERLFFSRNERTAMDVAQARGVILLTLQTHGIPYLEPTPPALKSCITGDGRADKQQVQDMLVKMLTLKEIPKPDDAADALALAVFGAINHKIVSLP
ncbi:MAG: crossover junction endodeoxyribonuclease RuvC [Candidatus Peribacteraceae bacterium]|nr:crossover junction endodeoxyribonuclease RuvC [Candidatus Peribacteraceae bacterium]